MSDWQDADPRATNGMEEMDNRRSYVGRTLVYSDRHGPYQFWRNGVQVPCVCDEDNGIVCDHHAPKDLEGTPVEPRESPSSDDEYYYLDGKRYRKHDVYGGPHDSPPDQNVPFKSADGPA